MLVDELTLQSPVGFFNQMMTTRRLLGLSIVDRSTELPRRLAFSFWTDTDLREQMLYFEAATWGFDRVELTSLSGNRALLRLSQESSALTSWGLYDIFGERMTMLSPDRLMSQYFETNAEELKRPTLQGDQLVWVRERAADAPLELIILGLSR